MTCSCCNCSATPQVLHSFPTRRSSDLVEGLDLNHRDHRKMVVVDGRTAFTRGINISEVYSQGSSVGSSGNSKDAKRDRKSTRLNSSHSQISYAVFCLKKKIKKKKTRQN